MRKFLFLPLLSLLASCAKDDDRANNQENEFSRAISTKISGVNPTGIFTALDQIDKRRELQRAQERKNDRGYDSPSPF
jgi:hypothetical protein